MARSLRRRAQLDSLAEVQSEDLLVAPAILAERRTGDVA